MQAGQDRLQLAACPTGAAARSGEHLDLTTALEHFQITNVHPSDSYGHQAASYSARAGNQDSTQQLPFRGSGLA